MAPQHVTGIYEIRNRVNNKRYIGSAVNFPNRQRQHFQSLARGDHHCIALQRAHDMYGADAFEFNRLLVCSKENLIMYEQIAIDGLDPEYNSARVAGSVLGLKMSDEAKAKLSAAAKRTKNFTGKRHTDESRAKISANRKCKGGGIRAPERLAKISAALKGRVITPEQRAMISATLSGRSTGRGKLTEDQVRAIRDLDSKGMRQIEISEKLGILPKYVHTVVRKHGYTWVK